MEAGGGHCACCAAWYGVQNKPCKQLKPSPMPLPMSIEGMLEIFMLLYLMGCKIEATEHVTFSTCLNAVDYKL
jgi:hypothetical protein